MRKNNDLTFGANQRICPSILKMKMWPRNDAHLKHGENIFATQDHIHPSVVALSRPGQGGLQLRDSHLLCTCCVVNDPSDSPSAQLGVSGSQGEGTLVLVQLLYPAGRSLGGRRTPGCWVILCTFRWSHGIEHSLGKHWHNTHFFQRVWVVDGCVYAMNLLVTVLCLPPLHLTAFQSCCMWVHSLCECGWFPVHTECKSVLRVPHKCSCVVVPRIKWDKQYPRIGV